MKRVFVKVKGIVQGVGFRPFVYNLAVSQDLKGWLNNNSEGIYIDIEGEENNINSFLNNLKNNPPPLASIEEIVVEEKQLADFLSFNIKESKKEEGKTTLISPDISICEECKKEIMDTADRRYRYAFTNCTNCGPRFSIIEDIPYDRDKTTMKFFEMCKECEEEYEDPSNRRFHAQPNACEKCGPHLWIEDSNGKIIDTEDPIKWTQEKLKEGKIFAIKGIGGFHLACDAQNEFAIDTLRKRKNRPNKPFAVMMKNVESIKNYCLVNEIEEKLLDGIRKPIVILKQKEHNTLSENIAPNQKTLGIMLPYTPIHLLLFSKHIEVLVMTSANANGLPIEYTNEGARESLKNVADFFLMHNRNIFVPVDDSIVKVTAGRERLIRRGRGYTPEPVKIDSIKNILACGSNMKNTFCISKDNLLFLSQHNGDLDNIETYNHYIRNIEHFKNIFSFTPEYIACDIHPGYMSTQYAGSYKELKTITVQHHHAHIASCMAENKINNPVIGVCFDGTGYGEDGNIWGGEFFISDLKSFKRAAHLNYIKMPGGEKAVKEPWRMSVSYIYKSFNDISEKEKCKKTITDLYGKDALSILSVIDSNINCPETSSMGRLFDAVSSLIGVINLASYEGQAAVELEQIISNDNSCEAYSYEIEKRDAYIIKTDKLIQQIIEDRLKCVSKGIMALKFHNMIINVIKYICILLRKDFGINEVVLSGGVFQNSYLLENAKLQLKKEDFKVYSNGYIPTNDAGISIGQAIIANEIIKGN